MTPVIMELAVVKITSLTTNSDGDFLTMMTTDDVGQRNAFSVYIDPNFEVDWAKLRELAGENEFINIALVRYEEDA